MAVLRDAMMKCEMMHKILLHCPSIFPMVAMMMGGIIPCSSAAAVMMTMSYRMQSSSTAAWVHISVPWLGPVARYGTSWSTSTS